VVVGRDQTDLYGYFRWGFARVPGVEVVLDRRLGERRGQATGNGLAPERRRSERRRAAGARAELRARGFLITQRDPHAGVRDWGGLR
jgi:hypothetical protein